MPPKSAVPTYSKCNTSCNQEKRNHPYDGLIWQFSAHGVNSQSRLLDR